VTFRDNCKIAARLSARPLGTRGFAAKEAACSRDFYVYFYGGIK
jgi:hypothetical protein